MVGDPVWWGLGPEDTLYAVFPGLSIFWILV